MGISAGRLRHRVVIEAPVQDQDSSGAVEISWNPVATVWAAIEPMSAREFVASQTELSKVSTRIIVRYRNDVDSTCRLYHAGSDKYYNVEGVLADKNSGLEYLTLACSEGVRDA